MKKVKNKNKIEVYVSDEMLQRLDDFCDYTGLTRSSAIRRLIACDFLETVLKKEP